jgi:thioredoxin reductase
VTGPELLTPDVVVVGGGPAGLTAARELSRRFAVDVLVLEREREAGGIPRHSDHTGYGMRDLRRVLRGPAYARRLVDAAASAGARVLTEATVTGWSGERGLDVTSPQGRLRVQARAVVLASGARERPRSARLVPGDRPAGVLTTGQLQQLVQLRGRLPARRAVVVGAELVSWSAVLTLREAGCRTTLMTTEHASPESYAAFHLPGRALLRVPVATRSRVVRIDGRSSVESVEVEDLRTGARRAVPCDLVVFTGSWTPDSDLARRGGLDLDPGTRGPLVDATLATSRPGVFAVGNLVHPVDTADVAALDGRHVAGSVHRWLRGAAAATQPLSLEVEPPLLWVAPGLFHPGGPRPPRGRLLLWSVEPRPVARVVVRQDGRVLRRRTLPWPVSPGRVLRVPSRVLAPADPRGGPVTIALG